MADDGRRTDAAGDRVAYIFREKAGLGLGSLDLVRWDGQWTRHADDKWMDKKGSKMVIKS